MSSSSDIARNSRLYGTALDPQAQLGLYFPLVPGWREWRQSASVSSEGPESLAPPTDII